MDTTNYKYKNGVTDDFATTISQISGQDLTWFINQWVKYPDHPIYQNTYWFANSGGNWSTGFTARQIQTTTPFHRMPVTLKITFVTGPDTTIRVMNDYTGQTWIFNHNRQPLTFAFDPNNDIVLKSGTTVNGIAEENQTPKKFALYQNYPNPFNPSTRISFDLPSKSFVTVKIYNSIGQLVLTPVNEDRVAGSHVIEINANNLPSGIYFYEINAQDKNSGKGFVDTKKMALVK
jgi:hypothetical protein